MPRNEQEAHIRAGSIDGRGHCAPLGVAAVQEGRDVDQGNGRGHAMPEANPMPAPPSPPYGTIARNRKAANITRWTMPCSTVVRPVPRVTTPGNSVKRKQELFLGAEAEFQPLIEDDRHHGHRRDGEADAGEEPNRAPGSGWSAADWRGPPSPPRHPFRQEHEGGDHDADHGLRSVEPSDTRLERRRQGLGQANHGDQETTSSPRLTRARRLEGGGACSSVEPTSIGRK